MARVYAPRPNEVFVRSEANGFKSRDEITLKQSATVYEVGTPVVAEIVADVATGLYVRLTDTIIADDDGYPTKTVSLVLHRTDATEGNTPAAGFSRDGVVKPGEIELPEDVTISDLIPLFAAQDVLIR